MEQRKKESGIRLEDVAAGYGRKALLNHISLHVSPGNVLTLIGPNGAGKSTILKTVTRQLAELGGTIFLEGTAMSRMREEEVARTLAMVMTERLHPEFMTCREVVATGRYPYTGRLGILSAEDWKLVDDAMQLVHAGDTADRNFSQISDGQRQRVMLARAICPGAADSDSGRTDFLPGHALQDRHFIQYPKTRGRKKYGGCHVAPRTGSGVKGIGCDRLCGGRPHRENRNA